MLIALSVGCAISGRADARQPNRQQQFDQYADQVKAIIPVDPKAAIVNAEKLYGYAALLPAPARAAATAKALWLQGEGYLRIEEPDRAAPLLDGALKALSADPRPSKLKGDVLLSLGWYHGAKLEVGTALHDYQTAYTMFRMIGENRSQAVALTALAALYNEGKDYKNSLKYLNQAIETYSGDDNLMISMFNNRGNVQRNLGAPNSSISDLKQAFRLAQRLRSSYLQQIILANYIITECRIGNYQKANQLLSLGEVIRRTGNSADIDKQVLTAAATVHFFEGRLNEAKREIEKSLAGDVANTEASSHDAHDIAYQIYRKLNDQPRALAHLEALKTIDDKTAKLTASTAAALMAARFDFANQELRIERLRRRDLQRGLELERSRAQTQRIVFFVAAGAGLVMLVLLGFGLVTLRRSRNEVRAANIDLAATNAALGKALAAKTEFLATTSHEIRTPLNGILGMTQVMLADPALSADVRDRVTVVHGAGLSMRALVDDILDVAKMETGNLTVELLPVDIGPLMRDVSRLWHDQARQRGLTFTLDLNDAPARVVTDEARLRQVVFNLLSNAFKFTREGGVVLRIAGENIGEGETARLAIEVTDTGIGVAADKLDQIFEAFRQADAGTTRLFGGTGLGLAICRNIAQALGGEVSVTSAPDIGSRFRLVLPLVLAEAVEESVPTDALLIVDRNPISRAMLKTVLATRAPSIHCVGTIADAEMLLARGGVTLTLVEGAVLDGDPDRLAKFSVSARAAGARLGVLWSRPDGDIVPRLVAAGADIVIAKPIAGAALAARLYDGAPGDMPSGFVPLLASAAA